WRRAWRPPPGNDGRDRPPDSRPLPRPSWARRTSLSCRLGDRPAGLRALDTRAKGRGELVAQGLGLLLHDAEPELAEPADQRNLGGIVDLGAALGHWVEAELALRGQGAGLAPLLAPRDGQGAPRRILLGQLDHDVECRLDRAHRHANRGAVLVGVGDLDALAARQTGPDLRGIGDELPHPCDGCRHAKAVFNLHYLSATTFRLGEAAGSPAAGPTACPAPAGAARSTGLPGDDHLLVQEPAVVEDHVVVENDRAVAHRHVVVALGGA